MPLDEVADECLHLLIAQGRASEPTPELRREIELHLWLVSLCDACSARFSTA